jgi:putative SOS response-associated peptidase YedK
MPVILAPEHYDLWLDPTMQEVCRLQPLLRPYPSEAMVAYPVSPQVNHPAHDALDCMASVVRTLEARSAP